MNEKKETFKEAVNCFIDDIMSKKIFRTYEDTGKIMVYDINSGTYSPAESTIVYECCQNETTNTPAAKAIVEMNIRGRTYVSRHQYSDAVAVQNGVLMFDKDVPYLVPHSPKIMFESKLQIPFDANAKCPVFLDMLPKIFTSGMDVMLLQEWFGYHFMKGQPFEKSMFFTGKRSTGKSTIVWILDTLLGNCCSHWQLCDLTEDRNYCTADLYGKLGNTYTDMGTTVISDCGKFKVLTGSRDQLTARMPYEKPFSFQNSAKLTFACNKLPPLSSATQGDMAFWKRVLLLQFHNTIDKPDYSIYSKLESELPGILNWALEGYARLKRTGKFTQNTEDVYREWTTSAYSQNPIQDFVDERMQRTEIGYIQVDMFNILYEKYCIEVKETPCSKQELRALLAQIGIFESMKFNKETGIKMRIYKGVCEL
jgi:putative DNA primase/helicase